MYVRPFHANMQANTVPNKPFCRKNRLFRYITKNYETPVSIQTAQANRTV
jgi:hypothetical protein